MNNTTITAEALTKAFGLTYRQAQVAFELFNGATIHKTAIALNIGCKAVEAHVWKVYRILQVSCRREMIAKIHSLITPSPTVTTLAHGGLNWSFDPLTGTIFLRGQKAGVIDPATNGRCAELLVAQANACQLMLKHFGRNSQAQEEALDQAADACFIQIR